MADFRSYTPVRSPITTTVTKYSDHKPDLAVDFKRRCGYCNSPDSWKIAYFEVDHFIPRKRNKTIFLTIKTEDDYSNLVYSCRSCNNAKSNKWPTNDQLVPNKNDEGFVDPCDASYNGHFYRKYNGELFYNDNLGKWMYYAMKFHKKQHQIIWQLEALESTIAQIKQITNISALPEKLKDQIIALFIEYDNYRDQLRNI